MKIAIVPMTVSNIDYLVEWLEGKFDEVRLNPGKRLEGRELVDFVGDAEVFILGVEKMNTSVARELAGKKCIKWGVGTDNIDFAACNEHGIDIFRTTGLNSRAVCQLAVSYIIQLLRNQHVSFHSARSGSWNKTVGKELCDAKIGILGLGTIGELVHDSLAALIGNDDNIYYNDIEPLIAGGKNYMRVDRLFSECDIVTVHIDNDGGRNDNFIDWKLLNMMKGGAYLVNTARGSVIDYLHLTTFMPKLGGVALDVFPDEPNVPKFFQMTDRAILSCHIAGNSEAALRNGADFVKDSVESILK